MIDVLSFPLTAGQTPRFLQLETVGSTNDALKASGWSTPFATVLSTHQTAGRGRRGRTWLGAPGESLAMSVLLPQISTGASAPSWLPLLVGVAVVSSLREVGLSDASLKWPNDVLISGKKLAGILCEALPGGGIIAGIGLNISFSDYPPAPLATSLAEQRLVDGTTVDGLVSKIVKHLKKMVSLTPEEVLESARGAMMTLGLSVEVVEADGTRWTGSAHDLNAEGLLAVRDQSGVNRLLAAADVEHLYQ